MKRFALGAIVASLVVLVGSGAALAGDPDYEEVCRLAGKAIVVAPSTYEEIFIKDLSEPGRAAVYLEFDALNEMAVPIRWGVACEFDLTRNENSARPAMKRMVVNRAPATGDQMLAVEAAIALHFMPASEGE